MTPVKPLIQLVEADVQGQPKSVLRAARLQKAVGHSQRASQGQGGVMLPPLRKWSEVGARWLLGRS